MSDGAPGKPGAADSPPSAPERKPLSPGAVVLIGLAALAASGLADGALAARQFPLALVYVPPLLALAWLAGWRFAAICTVAAAAINFGIDASLNSSLSNSLLVHASNLAIFILCVPLERIVATTRFLLEYTRRGDARKAAIQPARIGQWVVLVPVWRREEAASVPEQASDVHVLLDPDHALSTGSPPATVMCVGLLEQFVKRGDRLLDQGCETGILSLAALKLGAVTALAADAQSESVQATLANARLNDLAGRMEVRLGSLEEILAPPLERDTQPFDVTVVNSPPDVIVNGLKAGLGAPSFRRAC